MAVTRAAAEEGTAMAASGISWRPFPEATRLVDELLLAMRARAPSLERLARRMRDETGTKIVDFVDHLGAPADVLDERKLEALGFVARPRGPHPEGAFVHPEALLPPLVALEGEHRVALRVESVADFLVAHGAISSARIEGPPGAPLRRALLASEGGA